MPQQHPPLRHATTWKHVLALLKTLPTLVFLGTTLLLVNLFQVWSLLLRPISQRHFRAFNRYLADTWWGWCVVAARRVHGMDVRITGDEIPARENAIVVANHQQMPDIMCLMFLARTKHRLGDLKWFVKSQLKWVPGVGWGMQFLDCIFVKRSWSRDKESISRTFSRFADYDIPIWLVSFVEGTRFTNPKLQAARDFARERELFLPSHVLLPRTKGFTASVLGLREHLDAVYDITIAYPGQPPTLWQYAQGLVPIAHVHIRRYAMADLPVSREDLAAWLLDLFQGKDELLEYFHSHGAFPCADY